MKKYSVKNKDGKYLTMIGAGNWSLVASKDMRYTFDTEKQAEMAVKMAKGQKDTIKDEDLEVVAEGIQYVKTYESFLVENIQGISDFVMKFELAGIDDQFEKEMVNFIKDVIKFYKENDIDGLKNKYPNYKGLMKAAYKAYDDNLIRLALPQGSLQQK